VVGDVAASVRPHELGAHRGRGHEDVAEIGPHAERVDVRVLEQQEVLVATPFVEGALQLVGLAERNATEPADVQRRQSSASQSRVSRMSLIRTRKLAA